MTVSGWTMRMQSFQPDQTRESQTRRIRSRSLSLSRGRDRVGRMTTSSSCSSAMFRAASSHRLVNADQNARATLRRMANMGGFPTTAAGGKPYDLVADGVSSRDTQRYHSEPTGPPSFPPNSATKGSMAADRHTHNRCSCRRPAARSVARQGNERPAQSNYGSRRSAAGQGTPFVNRYA